MRSDSLFPNLFPNVILSISNALLPSVNSPSELCCLKLYYACFQCCYRVFNYSRWEVMPSVFSTAQCCSAVLSYCFDVLIVLCQFWILWSTLEILLFAFHILLFVYRILCSKIRVIHYSAAGSLILSQQIVQHGELESRMKSLAMVKFDFITTKFS